MTERVNLVDAYDNRSVIAKMVNMEERISGAETSVKASAEAAASSASAAAASQTAARTSEDNAAAAAASAAATLADTVDLSSKQTVTGAKTFAGDTTVTGSFVTSGNAEMSKLDIDTGTLTVGRGGTVLINGALTASNAANVIVAEGLTVGPDGTIVIDGNVTLSIKSGSITLASGASLKSTDGNVSIKGSNNYFQGAHHASVLQTNDILTSRDVNEVNGKANNLMHRSGDETKAGIFTVENLTENMYFSHKFIPSSMSVGKFIEFLKIERSSIGAYHIIEFAQSSNSAPCYGRLLIHESNGESVWIDRCFAGGNNPLTSDTIHICTSSADNYLHVYFKKIVAYGGLMARRVFEESYQINRSEEDSKETWIPLSDITVIDAIPDTMTEITIKEPYQA